MQDDISMVESQGSERMLGGGPGVPTSAAHMADQLEKGGARVEEALNRMNCRYQTLFFVAGMLILFQASLAFLGSIVGFQPASAIVSIFLAGCGGSMMILDVPGNPRWASRYRANIRRNFRFLTRLIGKALWFFFLSALTVINMWPTDPEQSIPFLAMLISLYGFSVGIIGFLIAVKKSVRLEKVRKAIQISCHEMYADVYRKYAMTDPQHGMQFEEFNRMCCDHTNGKVQFDIVELGIIYNSLDEHQKSALNDREFLDWMGGSMVYL